MIPQKLLYYRAWLGLGILILVFITWSSLSPIIATAITVQYSDLALHLVCYGLLTFWFQQIYRSNKAVLVVAVGMIGYGILMEAAQGLLTTTRDANVLDIIANSTGVLLGTLVGRWFRPHGLFCYIEKYLPSF